MITATDLFCGAGGSSSGLAAAGAEVRMAVNHWQLAIETHSTNHPQTDHDCVDVRTVHPSQYPRTTIGWFSPECTNHSLAKGKRRRGLGQIDLWGNSQVDPAEERSRATMREVVEFSEYHRYEIVIVENVVDIRLWAYYHDWLTAMINLGYDYRELYINAQFFGVPQSRDRIYVVFWKRGNRAPDLEFCPPAECNRCGRIEAVQTWKKADRRFGKYGSKNGQYVYCCSTCGDEVRPFHTPAYVAIDWALPTPRVDSRSKPLKDKTLERIRTGIQKFARVVNADQVLTPPFLTSQHNNADGSSTRVSAADQPLPCVTTFNNEHALVVPPFVTQLRYGGSPASVNEAMPTQTARAESALVVPPMLMMMQGVNRTFTPDEALSTIIASGSQHVLITPPIMMTMRKDYDLTSVEQPLSTVVASATHQALIAPPIISAYYGAAWTHASAGDALPTVTTVSRHALIIPDEVIDACGFRMLEPHELKLGMSFDREYIVLGNKREQTRQVGNAVCPLVAQMIAERCIASLA